MSQPLRLTEADKKKLFDLIQNGKPLPPVYKSKLFAPEDATFIQATKEYRLVYEGKTRREDIIATTPEAPFQLVRQFNEDNPFPDGWRNMLVYGDNLLALKELYVDQRGPNRYRTRDRIKLIYIDPPFATKQDFMKDNEKAYRDKVIGAQFIEFLRKRLVLLREVLADDGSIYVHLDTKKGHYLKAVLDELFDETSFQNEIIWKRTTARSDSNTFNHIHDNILFYTKGQRFIWNTQHTGYSARYLDTNFKPDSNGRLYRESPLTASETRTGLSGKPWKGVDPGKVGKGRHWAIPKFVRHLLSEEAKKNTLKALDELEAMGRIIWASEGEGRPNIIQYEDDLPGVELQSIWTDFGALSGSSSEATGYPTQKPEALLARIIESSSKPGDIVLDAFAGAGTTAVVAEKLGRRWIAVDCGKLAIYTVQKRLFSLTTTIGAAKKDSRPEPERVDDWPEHLKSAPGVLLITEKARKGECELTLDLLHDLAALAKKHNLVKKGSPLSIVCPEEKLRIPASHLQAPDDDGGPGSKRIEIEGVEFRLSFIDRRQETEKEKLLKPKTFALFSAGVYDDEAVKQMPWDDYRPFVLKLFQVREHTHFIRGLRCDGYVGVYSAFVWNYPDHKKLTIDYDYIKSLHETLGGNGGERFYLIAPIVSMGFAEDEYTVGDTTYVFLKVPISILMRLLQSGESGALKQPAKEADVNEVIDAIGFDFISQPEVRWKCKKERSPDAPLLRDYAIHVTEFRSKTLATDPEDFPNFETLSMGMVDTDYDGHIFKLSKVFWAGDLIAAETKRRKSEHKHKKKTDDEDAADQVDVSKCQQLSLRIPEAEFTGKQMLLILCDRYGNEKKLVLSKADFK